MLFQGIMEAVSSLTTPKDVASMTTTELEVKELQSSATTQRVYIMLIGLVFLLGLGATVYLVKK